jgi:tetratricopeptide (TPR) repeat protein
MICRSQAYRDFSLTLGTVASVARIPQPFASLFISVLLPLILVCLLNLPSSEQMITPEMQKMNTIGRASRDLSPNTVYETAPNTAVIVCHLFAEKQSVGLDRSARVDLTNAATNHGVFVIVSSHEDAVIANVSRGEYEIAVAAVGYLTTHQKVSILDNLAPKFVDVVLQRDPSAVILNEASGVMPRKAKKEANRAVSLLKSGQLASAQKHLETAYELAPSNADLNFLLGYLHFEKNDYTQATTYLGKAAILNPHSLQALTLLGRTNLLREDFSAARTALEQAVLVDPEEWLAHDLLAETYLGEKKYDKAREEAQIAIAKGQKHGKNAGSAAEIALGQALIASGRTDEGIRELETFLKQSPQNPMVYQVRTLIAKLKAGDPVSATAVRSTNSETKAFSVDSLGALPEPLLSMQTWRPPDVDDVKPNVVPEVPCPGTKVLKEAGKRVRELAQDLTRFAADEELFHQSLDAAGLSTSTETRKYDYVAALSSEPGAVFLDEYRTNKGMKTDNPDGIASAGFAMLAFVFHPQMQRDFDFDCEGRGEWRGEASWVVHFRQRHDLPNRLHTYQIGGEHFRIDLKGRAWISADNFQIIRIEADMVKPIREIELLSEHQTVEYGPVPFAKRHTSLWLPKRAEIYFDFRKHRYFRRHSFDHYMLFGVDSEEKDKAPTVTNQSSSHTE